MAVLYCFPEPETIYDCAHFLYLIQFLICCNSMWNNGTHFICNNWTRFYSVFTSTFGFSMLLYMLYYNLSDPVVIEKLKTLNTLLMGIAVLEVVFSMIMFFVSWVVMNYKAPLHIEFFRRIQAVDDCLRREFGADLNYGTLMLKNIITLLIITVVYITALTSLIPQVAHHNFSSSMFACWLYVYITGGPHITGYVHMNAVEIIGIRFRLLQKLMDRDYLLAKFPLESVRLARMHSILQLLKELCLLVNVVNNVYALPLLAALLHDFMLTTSEFYIIFGSSRAGDNGTNNKFLIYTGFIMLAPVYKMLRTPMYCQKALNDYHKCIQLIKRLDYWFPESPSVRQLVHSAMLWSIQTKVEFRIGLNIVLNRRTITVMSSAMLNYMLILIQFRMAQEMSEQLNKEKNAWNEWVDTSIESGIPLSTDN